MALSVFGYLFTNWQHMAYAMSIFPLVLLFFVGSIPESYRWYFGQQRQEEGVCHIKDYTKKCGAELEDEFIAHIVNQYDARMPDNGTSVRRYYTVRDLFVTPQIRKITLKMMVVYMVTTMVYYALFLVKLPGMSHLL